jgi:hypothetical protein
MVWDRFNCIVSGITDMLEVSDGFDDPPDILAWLERFFSVPPVDPFPKVTDIADSISGQADTYPQKTEYEACRLTGLLSRFFSIAFSGNDDAGEGLISCMANEGFTLAQVHALPIGLSIPLLQVMRMCKESPLNTWEEAEYSLIGRKDLTYMANFNTQNIDVYANFDTVFLKFD